MKSKKNKSPSFFREHPLVTVLLGGLTAYSVYEGIRNVQLRQRLRDTESMYTDLAVQKHLAEGRAIFNRGMYVEAKKHNKINK